MASVTGAAKSVTGVSDAKVDFDAKTIRVLFDPKQCDADKIADAIKAKNYGVTKIE